MESLTYMKNLDISPKKLRMMLPSIKKMTPVEATNVLYYSPKRSARIFYKAIKSAINNAKQTLKVSDDLLQFKLFTIEEGQKLKRYLAGSRGGVNPYKKRYSHIKIILTAPSTEKVEKTKEVKENVKKSEKAESEVKVPEEKKTVKKGAAKKKAAVKKTVKK
jgi:large subunit ribosomal protein L22